MSIRAARSGSSQGCAGVADSSCERAASYYSREYRVKNILAGWRGVAKNGRFRDTSILINPLTLQIHLSYGLVVPVVSTKAGHGLDRSTFLHRVSDI